jgi:hypothetical protein
MKSSTLIIGFLVFVIFCLMMRSSMYETPEETEAPTPTPTMTTGEKVTDILQRINGLVMPM